jgi:hypothetical protein
MDKAYKANGNKKHLTLDFQSTFSFSKSQYPNLNLRDSAQI